MNKLVPVFVERKHAPKVRTKVTITRPFEKLWPSIMEDIVKEPKIKTRELWDRWKRKIENVHSYNEFANLLRKNKMTPKLVREKTSISAQAEIVLSTFASGKKTYAERHNQRIHNKLEQIHDVVEGISVTEDNVVEVLDVVSRLQREGRITYDIDSDKPVDKTVVNLALMMGFDARPKVVDV
jgi:hypothetical protein